MRTTILLLLFLSAAAVFLPSAEAGVVNETALWAQCLKSGYPGFCFNVSRRFAAAFPVLNDTAMAQLMSHLAIRGTADTTFKALRIAADPKTSPEVAEVLRDCANRRFKAVMDDLWTARVALGTSDSATAVTQLNKAWNEYGKCADIMNAPDYKGPITPISYDVFKLKDYVEMARDYIAYAFSIPPPPYVNPPPYVPPPPSV